MAVSGDPAGYKVMLELESQVGALIAGATVDTTVERTSIADETILEQGVFPCAILRPGTERFDPPGETGTEVVEGRLRILVDLYVSTMTEPTRAVSRFAKDVMALITDDHQIGGTCRYAYVTEIDPFVVLTQTNPLHGSRVTVEVSVRTDRDDLTTPI